MKISNYLLILTIMICALLCGCANSEVLYPILNLPQPGQEKPSTDVVFEYNNEIVPNISKLMVYRFADASLTQLETQLSSVFSVHNTFKELDALRLYRDEKRVIGINTSNGSWSYTNYEFDDTMYRDCHSGLTDDECIKIAENLAADHDLDLSIFKNIIVTPIQQKIATENSKTIGHTVFFYPVIDGYNVYGVSRFYVTINGDGNVSSIICVKKDIAPFMEESIIGIDDALNILKSSDTPTIVGDEDVTNVRIFECNYGYYADTKPISEQPYLQPVMVLKGIGRDLEGNESDYMAIIPAIKN